MESLLSILQDVAVVPSFSSYEEKILPYIISNIEKIEGASWHRVPDNNLVATIPGNPGRKPVALAAHLDKINHFGENPPKKLPFHLEDSRVTGQMDNSVGIAIILAAAQLAASRSFPPLLLLFSEMEESFGLKHHPRLLKNGGKGLRHGMGAERISRYLIENKQRLSCVMTVDTTPLFKGEQGVALYSGHWEFTGKTPSPSEVKRTNEVRDELLSIDPEILLANNTNDYLHYGVELNRDNQNGIPSLALEPAIHPYHEKNESVFLDDIDRVYRILIRWLEQRK